MTSAITRKAPLWAAGWLSCAALLGGCFLGNQTGQEDSNHLDPGCTMGERQPLAADTPTELGFTAGEVEAGLAAPMTSSLLWSRMNTRSELTLELLEVRARFLNTNGECPDTIGLDVRVAVRTADGLLDEQLDATVDAGALDNVMITAQVAPDAVAGTLTPADLDLDLGNWRDPMLTIRLRHGGGGLSGLIDLGGDDPDPSDNSTPVSAVLAELPAP